MASRSSGAGATSALPPLRRRGGDQHHLPPLSLGSGLPRMSGRAVVVGACPGGRQMGPARGCRRVPGKDVRDGVAATERHRSGAFSAPGVATKTAKSTWRSLCPPYPSPQCRQSDGAEVSF
jgi:hypothetical protein